MLKKSVLDFSSENGRGGAASPFPKINHLRDRFPSDASLHRASMLLKMIFQQHAGESAHVPASDFAPILGAGQGNDRR